MDFFRAHILSITLFLPLAGAFLVMLVKKDSTVRWVANLVSLAGFLVSLLLVWWFDAGHGGMQFVEQAEWIPSIGARYHLGIDGISFLLIMLTTLLGFISILSSWSAITERLK